ncbi:YbbC/YhhH family protein [Paraherbaspirillum soli]|uniref:YbbC/YhhH family protein n=1 Tax=Paraherbaspirillum soli TaxID=631222 RepID=A0ABW0MFH3_9BURK
MKRSNMTLSRSVPQAERWRINTLAVMNMVLLGAMAVANSAQAHEPEKHNVQPAAGYVPSSEIAIKIAVAIWEPIYGREAIAQQKPYQAMLKNGIWVVEGSLPKDYAGGTAIAEIAKDDGRVLRVSHGK